jgi:hypothetical protein
MHLQVVGAGLPRTGTSSLRQALEQLLGGACCHMTVLPGHPFDLADGWRLALARGTPNWDQLMEPYVAAVDWPASLFWRELSQANPEALVLLSVRASPQEWVQSLEATILPVARRALAPDWSQGRDLLDMFERFTGARHWDDPAVLAAAYDRHNAEVRRAIPPYRLLEWRAADGWAPICRALSLPVPAAPFPWTNRRSEWGS